MLQHDDIVSWKHFRYRFPFVRRIRRLPLGFAHKRTVMETFDVAILLAWTSFSKTIKIPEIWDVMTLMWRHCSGMVTMQWRFYILITLSMGNICRRNFPINILDETFQYLFSFHHVRQPIVGPFYICKTYVPSDPSKLTRITWQHLKQYRVGLKHRHGRILRVKVVYETTWFVSRYM